jgi:hypothetical protein
MAAENYESASALAMQYNRTRTRTRTEEGNEPQHKPSRQHASQATRRGSTSKPAKGQAMTVTSRSRVPMFCASGATTCYKVLLLPSKSCYCTVANSAICKCVILQLLLIGQCATMTWYIRAMAFPVQLNQGGANNDTDCNNMF